MSSVKSFAVIAVLSAVGVALYLKMHGGPEPEPPVEFTGGWGVPPSVDMPFARTTPEAPTVAPRWDESPGASGTVDEARTVQAPQPPGGSETTRSGGPFGSPQGPPQTSDTLNNSPARPPLGAVTPYAPPWGHANDPTPTDGSEAAGTAEPYVPPATDPQQSVTPPNQEFSSAQAQMDTPSSYAAIRQAAQEALDQGRLAEAHLILSRWYGDPSLSATEKYELINLLSQLAGSVIYSTQHLVEPAHEVQTGETLETIAEKYGVPWQLLAKINGVEQPNEIVPGQQVKVVRGPFTAIVDLEDRELTLTVSGYYAGRFPIAVGTEREDLAGQWEVGHKSTNPTYFGPDRTIDAEDPANPLGEHWIGLANSEPQSTVRPMGIHGTYDAQSIYQEDPRGYIRLAPQDAHDVYDILSVGSRVIIRR